MLKMLCFSLDYFLVFSLLCVFAWLFLLRCCCCFVCLFVCFSIFSGGGGGDEGGNLVALHFTCITQCWV